MGSQVKSVNLSEGELLSIRGVDGPTLTVLANQTLLVEGQVIRSPTNTISVYFRTFQDDGLGTFQLHYQGKGLLRPARGRHRPHSPLTPGHTLEGFHARNPTGTPIKSTSPSSLTKMFFKGKRGRCIILGLERAQGKSLPYKHKRQCSHPHKDQCFHSHKEHCSIPIRGSAPIPRTHIESQGRFHQ